jgi:hypothetical protein
MLFSWLVFSRCEITSVPVAAAYLFLVRRMKIVALLLIAVIALASRLVAASPALTEKDLVGQWYRGDHLGYNVLLIVSRDHTYKASWTGDEIDEKTLTRLPYGEANGRWALDGDRLVITPAKETKHTRGDLATMRIVRQHRKIYLVPIHSLKVPAAFHLDPMMVFEREAR